MPNLFPQYTVLRDDSVYNLNFAHPLVNGLSNMIVGYNQMYSGFPAYSRYPQNSIPTGWGNTSFEGFPGPGSDGVGFDCNLATDVTYPGTNTNNGFAMKAQGTIAAYARANFSPTDSLGHTLAMIGVANSTGAYLIKFTDNNWYAGFFTGVENRVVVSASSTFTIGDSFVAGFSWNASTTFLYVKGKQLGTHATPASVPACTGASNCYSFNRWETGSNPWASNSVAANIYSTIYWVAQWDIPLSITDFQYLNAEPWAMFRPSLEMMAIQAPASAAGTSRSWGYVFA